MCASIVEFFFLLFEPFRDRSILALPSWTLPKSKSPRSCTYYTYRVDFFFPIFELRILLTNMIFDGLSVSRLAEVEFKQRRPVSDWIQKNPAPRACPKKSAAPPMPFRSLTCLFGAPLSPPLRAPKPCVCTADTMSIAVAETIWIMHDNSGASHYHYVCMLYGGSTTPACQEQSEATERSRTAQRDTDN